MASRRPVVILGGKFKQLPLGDTIMGTPLVVLVGLSSGTVVRVPLDAAARLPIGLNAGGVVNVPTGVQA